MHQTEELKFCRKCVIPDFVEDKEGFLSTYLGRINEEDRTEDEVYDNRLEACNKCSHFINGMCRLCGCFVAIRAAVRNNTCPDIKSNWGVKS